MTSTSGSRNAGTGRLFAAMLCIATITHLGLHARAQQRRNPDVTLIRLDRRPPRAEARIFAPERFLPPLTHYGMVFSPDGKEIFYTVMIKDTTGRYRGVILELKWRDGAWSDPGIAPFSGVHSDHTPNIAAIVFTSNQTLDIDLGFTGTDNPQEPATYGWEYRDLSIDLVP